MQSKAFESDGLGPAQLNRLPQRRHGPVIGITRDAEVAVQAGRVTAMHDPTEGGLAAALWELATASNASFVITPEKIEVPPLSRKICTHFGLDPLATIASGALLLTCEADDASAICTALQAEGIGCAQIGQVTAEVPGVWIMQDGSRVKLFRPERDEIARFYEEQN